jgi:hypothetical protein
VGVDERGQVLAVEGGRAGQALVQHTGQGIDVGPPVDRLVGEPLRGHVVQRPDGGPGNRQRCLPGTGRPRYAEVDHVNEVALRDQDVRGLDIAVDEVVRVGGIQGLGDLAEKVHGPLRRDGAVCLEQRADINAVDQAHVNE